MKTARFAASTACTSFAVAGIRATPLADRTSVSASFFVNSVHRLRCQHWRPRHPQRPCPARGRCSRVRPARTSFFVTGCQNETFPPDF
jgi:hypothetical protein